MSARGESIPPYGRARSSTVSSIQQHRISPPLPVGATKTLQAWIHPDSSPNVLLNPNVWSGVADGDLIQVSPVSESNKGPDAPNFLFFAKLEDDSRQARLQISIPKSIGETFSINSHNEVKCTKVDKNEYAADSIEISFKDQYLGRSEMWRFLRFLQGQCVHVNQEIAFLGAVTANIQEIYIGGRKVTSAHVTSKTKSIFRSLSAKMTIFIQVCEELWQFASDGERYNEKIVHSFLPALVQRWRTAGTNHTVTLVLISRVFYDESELEYAAGPLRREDSFGHRWYKDFYKVITDLEVVHDWKPTLASLKDSFWAFQRDILLTHHYHRAAQMREQGPTRPETVRLVGKLSYAHDGPVLEALNLALNSLETHYIDRSLSLTGMSNILITPGTGYFQVSKTLLKLTTTRLLDQGFGLDLVSLAKPPLHRTPIFSFQGAPVENNPERRVYGTDGRANDPLWGGNDESVANKTTYWWEPFWVLITFWDRQMDLPFRSDRFVARCKMHEIETLGLLEHGIYAPFAIPWMQTSTDIETPKDGEVANPFEARRAEADQYDNDVFALAKPTSLSGSRMMGSFTSSTSSRGSGGASSPRMSFEQDHPISGKRIADMRVSSIHSIEEKPSRETSPARSRPQDIPTPSRPLSIRSKVDEKSLATPSDSILSTSPSQRSIRSTKSISTSSTRSGKEGRSSEHGSSSKFAPTAWLLNAFRSVPNPIAPQATIVSATGISSTPKVSRDQPPNPMPRPSSTRPIPAVSSVSRRARASPDDSSARLPNRLSVLRNSPVGLSASPPREDGSFGSRRSTVTSLGNPTNPRPPVNPCRLGGPIPYTQSSLAKRWQHNLPEPTFTHQIKWKSLVTPCCLPLTVEYLPSQNELDTSYDVASYDFFLDPSETSSFLVRPPAGGMKGDGEESREAWALVILRGMASLRLAQGFQFIVRPSKDAVRETSKELVDRTFTRRPSSYQVLGGFEGEQAPTCKGAADVLVDIHQPVYLSMSNEIHRLAYTGQGIQVKRYFRRSPVSAFEYKCLVWPKLGDGYKVSEIIFPGGGMEDYGWNRNDMLVAGYDRSLSENLKYWRTRFIVLPAYEPQESTAISSANGQSSDKLSPEEIRLLGIDKLAELFGKNRWMNPNDKDKPHFPPRILPTWLGPADCVLDETLVNQLNQLHEAGPLRKKAKSEKMIAESSPASIAKALHEEDPPLIKHNRWNGRSYASSFTGYELVSWLVREFKDISSREEATTKGKELMELGLFEHVKGLHGFLDGHYFYRLKGEHAVPSTPRARWWDRGRYAPEERPPNNEMGYQRKTKRIILTQQMILDVDQTVRKSDQAETVVMHYDVIHNANNAFHFELQWVGTTARCIDELLRTWQRHIRPYGLKLVEAYVDEISSVSNRNPLQSTFPIRLAVPPPEIPDLQKRLPEGKSAHCYFESAILTNEFGFVLDVEATNRYPSDIDVHYSYRRSSFTYSQYVHKSGAAFVQVLGGTEGFRFLTNRLLARGRKEGVPPTDTMPTAEVLRIALHEFCSNEDKLKTFYSKMTDETLIPSQELPEPPPLSI
ncbi:hypothetical protein SISSUDRAFT_1072030 [Sistotremastrum suecicum HHB10207 ss-3]|uniref:Vacuolar membrane-associated protein IML1 n=1 Tax=Sistotremastrum suecicum HHB10207 ss-3 TaxID=1314776 RepID=A0A165ZWX2_9AGAM|nr:hypothetical protein SISSUDRAFT_1072030 [Sistotremastrum suecicum HHB10207 ss-3]